MPDRWRYMCGQYYAAGLWKPSVCTGHTYQQCKRILQKWTAQHEWRAAQGRSDLQRRHAVPPHGRNSGLHVTARLHAGLRHRGSSDWVATQKKTGMFLCRVRRTARAQLATRCTRGRSETRRCAMATYELWQHISYGHILVMATAVQVCHGWRAVDPSGKLHDNSATGIRCSCDGRTLYYTQYAGSIDCRSVGPAAADKSFVLNECHQVTA